MTGLPESPSGLPSSKVRSHLKAGELSAAISIVGLPPVRYRSRTGVSRLGWGPGIYRAIPRMDSTQQEEPPIKIKVVQPKANLPTQFTWPANAKKLIFVAGPADPD